MSQGKAEAVLMVRCAECERRHGVRTRIGEMCLMPPELGGRWGWAPIRRWKTRDELTGGRRWTVQVGGDLKFSGGIEETCRRCKVPRRLSIRRLAIAAAEAHSRGVADITV